MNEKLTFESVPKAITGRRRVHPWGEMEIGEKRFVPDKTVRQLAGGAAHYFPRKFSLRTVPGKIIDGVEYSGGVDIYRLADAVVSDSQ